MFSEILGCVKDQAKAGPFTILQNGSGAGLELCNSKSNTELYDCLFDGSGLWARHVAAGDYIIFEANPILEVAIPKVVKNVFMFFDGIWVYVEKQTVLTVEIPGIGLKKVFMGTLFNLEEMMENTCLGSCLTDAGIERLTKTEYTFSSIPIINARSKESMIILDDLHRDYINNHEFKKDSIVVIKAGAGSGKTTTQLRLAKLHKGKKILYLAFNKSLVTEIEGKLRLPLWNIKNLEPKTFDSLLNKIYCRVQGRSPALTDFKASTIGTLVPWLQGKSFKVKNFYCKAFTNFCSDVKHRTIEEYCLKVLGKKHVILEDLWKRVLDGKLTTFDSIRKQCFLGRWFKDVLDTDYDMVFVDEVQDFDMAMLRMLLDDSSIPKLFVGDPRQSIYQWRGAINAFEYMPASALTVEFYSTFRIAEPALSEICSKFKDCWMISKANEDRETHFGSVCDGDKYTYLFRSWKQLLTTARQTQGTWIAGFDQKIVQMRRLHEKLQFVKGDCVDDDAEDDLPAFLRSISKEELEILIEDIEAHIVPKDKSLYKFYTVHSYKGLEDDIIRVADDVLLAEEPNLYYVAITRAKKKIIMDERASVGGGTIGKEIGLMDLLMGTLSAKKKAHVVAKDTVSKKTEGEEEKKPSKVKLWSEEEDIMLLDAIKRGISYEEITNLLGRSSLAIEFHLRKLGSELVHRGLSLQEAALKTGLEMSIIEMAVEEGRVKEAAYKKGKRWTEEETNTVLGLVKDGSTLLSISLTIGRTLGSVVQKLKEQALKFHKNGSTREEIMCITGLSSADIDAVTV
jgi:hypothetical protein